MSTTPGGGSGGKAAETPCPPVTPDRTRIPTGARDASSRLAGRLEPRRSTRADEAGFRTILRIPLSRNRAELGLLYAAFLGRSVTRVQSFSDELIPGEYQDWDFTWRHIEEGLGRLDDEGLIDWDKSERAFVFDAGPAGAFLRFQHLEKFRPYGATALRFSVTIAELDLSALSRKHVGHTDVFGSWSHGLHGLRYDVTIPPAPMLLGSDFIVEETLAWVGRHIVAHVRKAF